MKQYAEHDKVGICHPLRNEEMVVRTFSGGYPYFKGKVIVRSSNAEPIYSYGKNYEKDGKKFALFVWTTNRDEKDVEKMFESKLKEISEDKIKQVEGKGQFVYVD